MLLWNVHLEEHKIHKSRPEHFIIKPCGCSSNPYFNLNLWIENNKKHQDSTMTTNSLINWIIKSVLGVLQNFSTVCLDILSWALLDDVSFLLTWMPVKYFIQCKLYQEGRLYMVSWKPKTMFHNSWWYRSVACTFWYEWLHSWLYMS